nr:immunoglobulin heavy chain junction region [Macaca mulatta]MOX01329.1 immunoglobulin heavy chain junction region [Macaca mulatta]MOX01368.1 immunoglobulin heavy chain junction region [Macaca mulatta]MOX02222.1 immunoglobulin heavy chain junction region [Macaca mulatta]MOX02905.1 immunoglobulin heavy chain junction region [Macaca mulatta]
CTRAAVEAARDYYYDFDYW